MTFRPIFFAALMDLGLQVFEFVEQCITFGNESEARSCAEETGKGLDDCTKKGAGEVWRDIFLENMDALMFHTSGDNRGRWGQKHQRFPSSTRLMNLRSLLLARRVGDSVMRQMSGGGIDCRSQQRELTDLEVTVERETRGSGSTILPGSRDEDDIEKKEAKRIRLEGEEGKGDKVGRAHDFIDPSISMMATVTCDTHNFFTSMEYPPALCLNELHERLLKWTDCEVLRWCLAMPNVLCRLSQECENMCLDGNFSGHRIFSKEAVGRARACLQRLARLAPWVFLPKESQLDLRILVTSKSEERSSDGEGAISSGYFSWYRFKELRNNDKTITVLVEAFVEMLLTISLIWSSSSAGGEARRVLIARMLRVDLRDAPNSGRHSSSPRPKTEIARPPGPCSTESNGLSGEVRESGLMNALDWLPWLQHVWHVMNEGGKGTCSEPKTDVPSLHRRGHQQIRRSLIGIMTLWCAMQGQNDGQDNPEERSKLVMELAMHALLHISASGEGELMNSSPSQTALTSIPRALLHNVALFLFPIPFLSHISSTDPDSAILGDILAFAHSALIVRNNEMDRKTAMNIPLSSHGKEAQYMESSLLGVYSWLSVTINAQLHAAIVASDEKLRKPCLFPVTFPPFATFSTGRALWCYVFVGLSAASSCFELGKAGDKNEFTSTSSFNDTDPRAAILTKMLTLVRNEEEEGCAAGKLMLKEADCRECTAVVAIILQILEHETVSCHCLGRAQYNYKLIILIYILHTSLQIQTNKHTHTHIYI